MRAGDRNGHHGRESPVHGPQLRKNLASVHLLFIELVNSFTVGWKAGEGNLLGNFRSGRTSTATLNDGNLRDAQSVTVSDDGVPGLLALFQKSLKGSGNWDLGNPLLLLLFLLANLFLASDLLLPDSQGRAGLLNSEGQSSLFSGLGSTLLGRLDRDLFVTSLISAKSTLSG